MSDTEKPILVLAKELEDLRTRVLWLEQREEMASIMLRRAMTEHEMAVKAYWNLLCILRQKPEEVIEEVSQMAEQIGQEIEKPKPSPFAGKSIE